MLSKPAVAPFVAFMPVASAAMPAGGDEPSQSAAMFGMWFRPFDDIVVGRPGLKVPGVEGDARDGGGGNACIRE